MRCLVRICFAVLFAATVTFQNAYTRNDDGYYGYTGCLFSPSICQNDEDCANDGLFGRCRKISARSQEVYLYRLNDAQLMELETILHQLAISGYTWHHLYTQCVVTSVLLSYRYGVHLDGDICDKSEPVWRGNDIDQQQTESTDKLIDDLIDMLNAKISVMNKGLSNDRNVKSGVDYGGRFSIPSIKDNRKSGEDVADFLGRLSASDLRLLKDFLVYQDRHADSRGNSAEDGFVEKRHGVKNLKDSVIAKKVDPASSRTITQIVVHYDPGAEESSHKNEMKSVTETANLVNHDTSEALNSGISWPVPVSVNKVIDQEGQLLATSTPSKEIPSVIHLGESQEQESDESSLFSSDSSKSNASLLMIEEGSKSTNYMIPLYILCAFLVVLVIAAVILVIMRNKSHLKDKLALSSKDAMAKDEARLVTGDYQDLCREDMRLKLEEKKPLPTSSAVSPAEANKAFRRSDALAWQEEQMASSMDISTGHMILSYMEDHLKNRDKLLEDWNQLCSYDAEPKSIVAAIEPTNMRKNRYADILPYEHTRVRLQSAANVLESDYINACSITDDDPRCPAYIAAQGPLPHTVSDFWQMVWEQGSTTIVCLTRLTENEVNVCARYWPQEGSDLYHIYEVKLISEHDSSFGDFVVRSFCLKNIETNETRTVTQFHYLSWPGYGIPKSMKTLLDFRRKVNSSYHGRFCPVVVHCSDGAGQTGTYCVIDMVLNRLNKGAKEMDIAATLEHIRDQRMNMVRNKEQFEFCLEAIAEEVGGFLHATPSK